jgi:single-strand DNA-binding protein
MASVNKVILLGRLGRDPKTSDAQGLAICRLALATTRRYKGRDGEKKEETEWHNVVLFGKTAEIAQQYLQKGSEVYIEGRLRTHKYVGKKDGIERYVTEIVCESLQLGARPASGATEAEDSRLATEYRRPTNVNRPGPAAPAGDLPDESIDF